jgi:hypothetical protein
MCRAILEQLNHYQILNTDSAAWTIAVFWLFNRLIVNTSDLSRERSGDVALKEALSCVHNNFKMPKLWQIWRCYSMTTCLSVRTRESVLSVSSESSAGTWIRTFETSAAMYQSTEDRRALCANCWQSQSCWQMHWTAWHRTTEGVAVDSYDICIGQTVVQLVALLLLVSGGGEGDFFCIFLSDSLRFNSNTKFRQSCWKCR